MSFSIISNTWTNFAQNVFFWVATCSNDCKKRYSQSAKYIPTNKLARKFTYPTWGISENHRLKMDFFTGDMWSFPVPGNESRHFKRIQKKSPFFFKTNSKFQGPPLVVPIRLNTRTNFPACSTGFPAPKSRPIHASPTAQPTAGCTNSNPAGRSRGSTWQVGARHGFCSVLKEGGCSRGRG